MNDDIDETGSTDDDSFADESLAGLLGDPSVWAETHPALEDSIVAAITAEAATRPELVADTGLVESPTDSKVVPISASRRWFGPAVACVAAALTLLVGGLILTSGDDDEPGGLEVALAPTDFAPEAEALARVAETPLGTRIILDVSGLPPAEPGTYYEAWMRVDAEVGVSAGTFHLRGGDGEIELWSGVLAEDYPLLTVTVQDEGQAASSGVVVLRGLIGE